MVYLTGHVSTKQFWLIVMFITIKYMYMVVLSFKFVFRFMNNFKRKGHSWPSLLENLKTHCKFPLIETFLETLADNSKMVWYGYSHACTWTVHECSWIIQVIHWVIIAGLQIIYHVFNYYFCYLESDMWSVDMYCLMYYYCKLYC